MGLWFEHAYHQGDETKLLSRKFLDRLTLNSNTSFGRIKTSFTSGTITSTPVRESDEQIVVALDGLVSEITATPESYIAQLYLTQGPEGLFNLKGPASVILHDTRSSTTVLYRTPLTGYPLYYAYSNELLLAATNPIDLLSNEDVSGCLRDEELGHYFSLNFTALKGNYFSEIEQVHQGGMVVFTPGSVSKQCHSWVQPVFKKPAGTEAQSIQNYREILDKSIRRTIQPEKKYGIMLSSGMDSSSIAVFASRSLKSKGDNLTAYSWTLPGDAGGDESKRIQELCEFLDIPLKLFNGELFGPFDTLDDPLLLPDTPYTNPFWAINAACYEHAGNDGVDGLFNGNYADLLFPNSRYYLLEAFRDKEFKLAIAGISDILRQQGIHALKSSPALRALVASLIPFRRNRPKQFPEWLTRYTKDQLRVAEENFPEAVQYSRPDQYRTISCAFQAGYLGIDRYLSGRYGIERIEPHRDPELVNFCFRLPAYMSYRNGQMKYFAREAMRGLIPESIRNQPRAGDLNLLVRNSLQRNIDRVKDEVFSNGMVWDPYVKESWVRQKLQSVDDLSYGDILVIWNCLNFGLWTRAIKPGGSLYDDV